jgi:rare lipoprotein A
MEQNIYTAQAGAVLFRRYSNNCQFQYMMNKITLICCLWLASLAAFGQISGEQGYTERGKASYFADDRGRVTTRSGEKYDMNTLVASHPYLPFNTFVQVTNLDNGQSAIVRINDRIEAGDKLIYLSKYAAEKIGSIGMIAVDVKIEIVEDPNKGSTQPKPDNVAIEVIAPTKYPAMTDTNTKLKAEAPAKEVAKEVPEKKDLSKEVDTGDGKMMVGALPDYASDAPPIKAQEPTLKEQFWKVGTYTMDGESVKPLGYGVQVGTFVQIDDALELGNKFQNLQFGNVFIQSGWDAGHKSFRVLLGTFAKEEDTKEMLSFLNERKYNAFVRKHLGVQ